MARKRKPERQTPPPATDESGLPLVAAAVNKRELLLSLVVQCCDKHFSNAAKIRNWLKKEYNVSTFGKITPEQLPECFDKFCIYAAPVIEGVRNELT